MSADHKATAETESPSRAYRATVVLTRDGDESTEESRYSMFSAQELTPEGAFLVSDLLLELGELVTLELSLGSDKVRADARVVALDTGETSGMRVEFASLCDSDRQLILKQNSSQA